MTVTQKNPGKFVYSSHHPPGGVNAEKPFSCSTYPQFARWSMYSLYYVRTARSVSAASAAYLLGQVAIQLWYPPSSGLLSLLTSIVC